MNNNIVIALVIGLLLLGGMVYFSLSERATEVGEEIPDSSEEQRRGRPTDEAAELVGFGFIQDFIDSAPPQPNAEALERAYDALSQRAQQVVSPNTISRDLAGFVGVQDVPDQGVSVEDLQVSSDTATLIVGLNFSGGRVLRAINLVVENGEWKVESVEPLEQYPPIE